MIIERFAYASPLRNVDTGAKLILVLSGMGGVLYTAAPLPTALTLLVFAPLTVAGGKVPLRSYLRILSPPLIFLLSGALTIPLSIHVSPSPTVSFDPGGWQQVPPLICRSVGTLVPLLFLPLTTPMTDIVSCLRRIGVPAPIAEIMTVAYRMLFVLSVAFQEVRTAQDARLGYGTRSQGVRSARIAVAGIFARLFVRSRDLSRAAEARGLSGELRGIPPRFPHPVRDRMAASALGMLLLGASVAFGRTG